MVFSPSFAQRLSLARWLSLPLSRACAEVGWLPGVTDCRAAIKAKRIKISKLYSQ
jgi:hypothetical protein